MSSPGRDHHVRTDVDMREGYRSVVITDVTVG
jgi:hypothetical protein